MHAWLCQEYSANFGCWWCLAGKSSHCFPSYAEYKRLTFRDLQLYTFAWLFGFFASLTSYYVIATYISKPTSAQVEVAVYPPMPGDVTPTSGEEALEKEQVTFDGKEVKEEV